MALLLLEASPHRGLGVAGKLPPTCPLQYNIHNIFHNLSSLSPPRQAEKLPLFCVFRVPSNPYHHSHPAVLQGLIFLFSPTRNGSWPYISVIFSPPSVHSHAEMLHNYFLKEGGASSSSKILLVINGNLEKFLNFCSNHFPCL